VHESEKPWGEDNIVCAKCGYESRKVKKFCPRCGHSFSSVFKSSASKIESLMLALKSFGVLLCINILFLIVKIIPDKFHIHLEIIVEFLFISVILYSIYPFRSKISFLTRRFFNRYYSPFKLFSLAFITGLIIHLYFKLFESLGLQTLSYINKEDIGTLVVPWIFIKTVLFAPVFEEIFYRGYLYQKLRLVLKPKETILLQGLLFGIVHLNPITYISHTLIGILFGFFRYRTNSLLPGILFHVMWNFLVVSSQYWELLVI